ncbi:hypothetical protein [Empedobacter tilapiae]|uniref:hypothetical protein n=1 Tax=Empedobacter tilapiae TaxID=2491114 RepID=UPI0028D0D4EC|nr:hypothetical protein [Empedobacter tilapiae]
MNQPIKIKVSRIFLGLTIFFFLCFIIMYNIDGTEIARSQNFMLDFIAIIGFASFILCPLFSILSIIFNYRNRILYLVLLLSFIPFFGILKLFEGANFGGSF